MADPHDDERRREHRLLHRLRVGRVALNVFETRAPEGGTTRFWTLSTVNARGRDRHVTAGRMEELRPRLRELAAEARERRAQRQGPDQTRGWWRVTVRPGRELRDGSVLLEVVDVYRGRFRAELAAALNPRKDRALWPEPLRHRPSPGDHLLASEGLCPRIDRLIVRHRSQAPGPARPETPSPSPSPTVPPPPTPGPSRAPRAPEELARERYLTERDAERARPTRLGLWRQDYQPLKGEIARWTSALRFDEKTATTTQTQPGGLMTAVAPRKGRAPSRPLYLVGEPVGLPEHGLVKVLGGATDLEEARRQQSHEDARVRNAQRRELKEVIAFFQALDAPHRDQKREIVRLYQAQLDALGPGPEPGRPLEQKVAALRRAFGLGPEETKGRRVERPVGTEVEARRPAEGPPRSPAPGDLPGPGPSALRRIAADYKANRPEPDPWPESPRQPAPPPPASRRDTFQHWPVVRVKNFAPGRVVFEVVDCAESEGRAGLRVLRNAETSRDLAVWSHPYREPVAPKTTLSVGRDALRAHGPLRRLAQRALWRGQVAGEFATFGVAADEKFPPKVGDEVKLQARPDERGRPVDLRVVPVDYDWDAKRYTRRAPAGPEYAVLKKHPERPFVWVVAAVTDDRREAVAGKRAIERRGQEQKATLSPKQWPTLSIAP